MKFFFDHSSTYLILTYVVEFDRVHYPLPLTFQESPAPSDLKATLRRLQEELAQAKRESQASAELDLRCQTLAATIAAQAKEIDQLRKQVSQQQQQLQQQQQQLLDSPPLQHSPNGVGDLQSLKARLEKLEDELEGEKANHKRLMLHKNREYRELTEELEHERAVGLELRQEVAALRKGRPSDRSHRSPMSRFDPTAYPPLLSHFLWSFFLFFFSFFF